MKVLFLHGWQSVPGGVKPTYLAQHGHEVINPALPDEDFKAAVRIPAAIHPPHVHSREEEGFYILEGEITFQIGDQRLVATAGMIANMPVGTPHSFKNESKHLARML